MATCVPRTQGPGPGAYQLPPLIGYNKHDPSRYRNPQYSIGHQVHLAYRSIGPGPSYNVSNMTRNGKTCGPAYTLTSKKKDLTAPPTPGPGAYTVLDKSRANAFTMSSRPRMALRSTTPGPNQYNQPTSLGPKVPHLIAAPAYSIMGKTMLLSKAGSPGPASYAGTPTENYRPRQPKYTIPGKVSDITRQTTPGPAAYLPKVSKPCNAGFSFGLRVCAVPYITAADEIPCVVNH